MAMRCFGRQTGCLRLFDGQVKFLRLRTHEIADMRRFQRLPQFAFGGIRLGHQQIVTQRSCKKVALRRHLLAISLVRD